jgi:hypothetical protein
MSPAEQQRFAAIVHPLEPWHEEGYVWGAYIQHGKVISDPVIDRMAVPGWHELRLTQQDGEDWMLRAIPAVGEETIVYTGRIADRQLWCRILRHGCIVRDWAHLLIS